MDRPEKMRRKMRKVEMPQTRDKKRGVFVFVGFCMWTIFEVSVEFVTILLLFWFGGHKECGILGFPR